MNFFFRICLLSLLLIPLETAATTQRVLICSWDTPGADKYKGTAEAAILALEEIPPDVRLTLVKRAKSNSYEDTVVIRRDSIQGKAGYEYSPELRRMAFGSQGRVCDSVTRFGWKADHVEEAMVFCAGDWCVARPSTCNNWVIVKRLPKTVAAAPEVSAEGSGGGGSGSYVPFLKPVVPAREAPLPLPTFQVASSGYPDLSPFNPIPWGYHYHWQDHGGWKPPIPPVIIPPVIPVVPEPSPLTLFITGLFVTCFIFHRRKATLMKS